MVKVLTEPDAEFFEFSLAHGGASGAGGDVGALHGDHDGRVGLGERRRTCRQCGYLYLCTLVKIEALTLALFYHFAHYIFKTKAFNLGPVDLICTLF